MTNKEKEREYEKASAWYKQMCLATADAADLVDLATAHHLMMMEQASRALNEANNRHRELS